MKLNGAIKMTKSVLFPVSSSVPWREQVALRGDDDDDDDSFVH
jgi:hypothetical protein